MVEPLSTDLLRGAAAIAQFIGENQRRTFYLCERGMIPVGKEGTNWIGSKRALSDHYAKVTGRQS